MKFSPFLFPILLAVTAVSAPAASRKVTIDAPTEVWASSSVTVSISARTDTGGGEIIGFLHAEYSTDGGKTWTPSVYLEKVGTATTEQIVFFAGAKGVKSLVRVRVAFRGGKAGDVDVTGKAIEWNGSWENWRAPCTKYAVIYVMGR